MVGVLHDEALRGLPEDLVQADGGHPLGADDLAQDVAGADAGQLVGIAHHQDAAAVPQRRDEGLEQLDVHHAHLVEDDDIALEQVLVVVDEADHAAGVVHFEQAVDGGGLPAGQLAQPLGRAARGSAEGHPLGLMFSSNCRMALTVVVLPVPGPPVRTRQFSVIALRMASFCSGA